MPNRQQRKNMYKSYLIEIKNYNRLLKRIDRLSKEKELSSIRISTMEQDLANRGGYKNVRIV